MFFGICVQKTREGVSITEITGRELSLVWSTSLAIEWVFEVAVEVSVCYMYVSAYSLQYIHVHSH